ncbi:unnamed protein product, partial [Gadus morhua 'NCC']
MLPAYKVLYYGFLSAEDKALYRDPLEALFRQHNVSEKAQLQIFSLHGDLNKKDPILRGHSQAVIHLKKLATNLQHFTDPESDVHLEIMGYSVSPDLASFIEGEDMVT